MLTGWEKEELLGRKKFVYEVRLCPLCLPLTSLIDLRRTQAL